MIYILWVIAGVIFTAGSNSWNFWKEGMIYYYLAAALLIGLSILVNKRKNSLLPMTYVVMRIALVLGSLFLVLQRMIGNVQYYKGTYHSFTGSVLLKNLLVTLIAGTILFCLAMFIFTAIRTGFYILVGMVGSVAVLILVGILPRLPFLHGASVQYGVYNSIKGILVIGPVAILLPFICAFFMSLPILKNGLRPGPILYTLYTVILGFLFLINHDLGAALVICGANIAFLLFCAVRGNAAKAFLVCGILVLLLLAMTSTTFRSRIDAVFSLFQNAYSAPMGTNGDYSPAQIAAKLSSELYLMVLTHGIYGTGYGVQDTMQAMNTDYIVYSLTYQLGPVFLIAFLIVAISLVLVMWRYISHCGKTSAEMDVMQIASYLFIIPIIWVILGNLGLLPLTGISFPLLVYGKSMFFAYSILLGVICGIMEKERGWWME